MLLQIQVIQVWSQGNLLITPTRILIDKSNQTEQISLRNTGSDSAIYSISFVNKLMTEEGGFVLVEKSDTSKLFSETYVRVFPRKVKLAPNESQTIKVQYKKQIDMIDGEYRSHLYFRDEKKNDPRKNDVKISDSTSIGLNIIPVFGITIPVIIRVGKLSATLRISDISIEKDDSGVPKVKMTLNRTGNCSVYGTITVNYTEPGGKPVEIGKVNGVGVYTEILKRHFTLRLPKEIKLNNGTITVAFINPDNNNKLDEQVMELK